MVGAFYAAYVAVNQPGIGSLSALIAHPALEGKLSIFPDVSNPSILITMFIIPIAFQWWAVWYPGSEPGGGGYIAQRMLAAKDEKNAIGATLLFNFAHYALRPWPWIIVALASIVLYPDLESIRAEFPGISDKYLGHDIAYPVMLTKLGAGWLGMVVASLIAAVMSTLSTHLNWGASYMVHDFYNRFVRKGASERELVIVGQVSTVLLMVISALLALFLLENASQAFEILLLSGAGSGAIYLLRWFWWRINAWTEIIAMISATIVAFILVLAVPGESLANELLDGSSMKLLLAVAFTTVVWIVTTFLTRPESMEVLKQFYLKVTPGGPGWKMVTEELEKEGMDLSAEQSEWDLPQSLLSVLLGSIGIYSALFSIGSFVYGNILTGILLAVVVAASVFLLFRTWSKLQIR